MSKSLANEDEPINYVARTQRGRSVKTLLVSIGPYLFS